MMTNAELIGYLDIHRHTDRALVHIDHINQFKALLGETTVSGGGFYVFRPTDDQLQQAREATRRG